MWGTWGTRKLMSWPKRQLRPRRQQCLWFSFPEAVQTRSQAVNPGQVAEALKHDQTLRVFEAYEKHPKSDGHMDGQIRYDVAANLCPIDSTRAGRKPVPHRFSTMSSLDQF
ncbi:hypothetical protein AVEN_200854-1 [Araneus ventricosus]|uniref:Uncharacterized protein n=1 Tax=Araneus ventricosus TaxID=182803 RepID=A0A4Y2UNC7_ARAVE|nr:hypothetical protein AVEN_200854-1 [Araneus ventricosus]